MKPAMQRCLFALPACALLACASNVAEFGKPGDSLAGGISISVESIACASSSDWESDSCFRDPDISFVAECVVSNKTPHQLKIPWWHIDRLFSGQAIYANGGNDEAVRMVTNPMSMPDEEGMKYFSMKTFSLKPFGSRKAEVAFVVSDYANLSRRLQDVKWQMLDRNDVMIPVVMQTQEQEGDVPFVHREEQEIHVEMTFPKTLPLEDMGGCPQKWQDPATGITWTYTVFHNEIRLGGGYEDLTAVSKETSGALEIPAEIEGKPVVKIGPFAFCHCERLTSVRVPPSVASIDHRAFGWCDRLTSLSISSNVTDIAESAFNTYFGDQPEGFEIHRY